MVSVMVLFTSFTITAQESDLPQSVIDKMEKVIEQKEGYRNDIFKDLHANPELAFNEVRTAGIVAKELKNLGFEVQAGISGTSVVGVLHNGERPTFMYRGNMDAVMVEENTGLPYASTKRLITDEGEEVPVALLCGHDANTTGVISLGHTLVQMKDHWSGTLVLVRQPAEEPVAGAQAMVDDGLYTKINVTKPDYFLAKHTSPFPTGTFIATDGRYTTGTPHMDIVFHGIGGHGSSPNHAIYPVVMAGNANHYRKWFWSGHL